MLMTKKDKWITGSTIDEINNENAMCCNNWEQAELLVYGVKLFSSWNVNQHYVWSD